MYELEGSYFGADGHHRVALSRQRGIEVITAEVTRTTLGGSNRDRLAEQSGRDVERFR